MLRRQRGASLVLDAFENADGGQDVARLGTFAAGDFNRWKRVLSGVRRYAQATVCCLVRSRRVRIARG